MAFDLNPLAVTAAPLLRAIHAGNWTTRTELAQAAGRLQNHIARDIGSLVKAGLAEERAADDCGKSVVLTDDGLAQLAALDRAADPNAAGAQTALHSEIEPHPLNPRKDFETAEAEEALDELRTSIVKSGLLQPIVVRPQPQAGKWWIIAGERRWRAIGQAISDGDWEDDRPIEITVREVDDRDHLLLALNENLQRSNMSAIEEGVAFAAAVHDFGMSTEDLANRTGKSQRYVQQRIALLKLDPVDQDRMRLPKDHPDFLSFKEARSLTQTPRPAQDFSQQMAEERAALAEEVAGDDISARASEPGSRDEDVVTNFGRSLTDREAVALIELVLKAERSPADDPALAAEGYTEIADENRYSRPDATRQALITKGLMAIRYRGSEKPHAKAYLTTSGAKAWLEQIGFYDPAKREDVLIEFRARWVGIENAKGYGAAYQTKWLNVNSHPTAPEAADREYQRPRNVGLPIPSLSSSEPEQPALIEETAEERQARQAAERERAAVAKDREVVQRLSDDVMRAFSEARSGANPYGEAFAGNGSNEALDALVGVAFGALAAAEPELAAAAIAQLLVRGGAMGARYTLQRRTLPEIERMMVAARVAKQDPNRGAADEASPDPVEDFVQAEIEEDEAGGEIWSEAAHHAAGPSEPAVPVRKSITPDFIVCLEDGRKFKSLKRHLRTRYNLSPEEYRAKWGLPTDYPMVAPNYAKARADLARQMGLGDPS